MPTKLVRPSTVTLSFTPRRSLVRSQYRPPTRRPVPIIGPAVFDLVAAARFLLARQRAARPSVASHAPLGPGPRVVVCPDGAMRAPAARRPVRHHYGKIATYRQRLSESSR